MKAELTLPPELVDQIVNKLFEKIKPLLIKNDVIEEEILNVSTLAKYLKVTPKWIYERTHLKEIPYYKVGGQLRFRREDIDNWIRSYRMPAVNPPTGIAKILK